MPIIINLDVMLAKRKKSLTELSDYLDLNMAGLSLLKTNKARGVRFKTLNNICKFLDCKPGDLIDYIDDKEYKNLLGMDWNEWLTLNEADEPDEPKKTKKQKK